jgi:GABA(A) receptor-associated protein
MSYQNAQYASYTTTSAPVLYTDRLISNESQNSIIKTTNIQNNDTNTSTRSPASTNNSIPTNDYNDKLKKSQQILEKYPDRVPVIVQPSSSDRVSYPIDKSKYITPRDLTLGQLQQIIRKRIKFPSEKALFMFINNRLYPITSCMGLLYDEHKNNDGFLYVTYCQENTFG